MANINTDVVIDEKIEKLTEEPNKYNVIFLNDDLTPIEWVIEVLKTVFKHSDQDAEALTMKIHNEGSAIAGTYAYEIAEQKALEVTSRSRDQGFPLQVKVDENK